MENRFLVRLLAVLLPVVLILASLLAGCAGQESAGASAETTTAETTTAGTAPAEAAAPATAADHDSPEDLPKPTDSGEDLSAPTETATSASAETPEELEPNTEAPEATAKLPAAQQTREAPLPFVRVLEPETRDCMTEAETFLYSVPRRDGEKIGILWEHQALSVEYAAAVRTEDGAESDWYLVTAAEDGNYLHAWLPAETLIAYDAAAELPKNAAFTLDHGDSYLEDGEWKSYDGYLSTDLDRCWFLTGTDANTGRPELVNREGRHIQLENREALRPFPYFLPLTWTDVPNAFPDPESKTAELPELSLTELRALLEQDAAELAQLPGADRWPKVLGGQTRFEGLFEPVGDRYRVTVSHSVQLTATAAEMEQAMQTGWLRLDGSWYLYLSDEDMRHCRQAPPIQINNWYPVGYVHAFSSSLRSHDALEVNPMGKDYFFMTGVDRFYWRLEKVTGTWQLWLDPDTPVEYEHIDYSNEEECYTRVIPLKDFGALWGSFDVHPRFDEDGNFSIYYYYDGK